MQLIGIDEDHQNPEKFSQVNLDKTLDGEMKSDKISHSLQKSPSKKTLQSSKTLIQAQLSVFADMKPKIPIAAIEDINIPVIDT